MARHAIGAGAETSGRFAIASERLKHPGRPAETAYPELVFKVTAD